MPNQPFFIGRVIKGSGKGSAQGVPTLNLDLADIPADLEEGIYAARVVIEGKSFDAAVHYGERPVHGLGKSFEAHLLTEKHQPSPAGLRSTGQALSTKHQTVTVEVVKRLREVRDFETEEELKDQIERDIQEVKKILQST